MFDWLVHNTMFALPCGKTKVLFDDDGDVKMKATQIGGIVGSSIARIT